jgi:hypothetical protein
MSVIDGFKPVGKKTVKAELHAMPAQGLLTQKTVMYHMPVSRRWGRAMSKKPAGSESARTIDPPIVLR